MTGTTDMICDFIVPILLKSFSDSAGDIIQYIIPGHTFPSTCAALPDTFERI
jgi:hypothetical protein